MDKINKINEVSRKAIDVFGTKAQALKAIEELSELSVCLSRWLNGGVKAEDIIDEIADVKIMAYQLCLMWGTDAVDKRIKFKLKRLSKRLKKNERK